MHLPSIYRLALRHAQRIERALRECGVWSQERPAPERLQTKAAFGADTLAFPEWLQFILVERIRSIAKSLDDYPDGSQVAVNAWRVLDASPGMQPLRRALDEFDAFINAIPGMNPGLAGAWEFLDAVRHRDWTAAAPLITAASRGFCAHEPWLADGRGVSFAVRKWEWEADGYTVFVNARIRDHIGPLEERPLILRLADEEAEWHVDLAATHERSIANLKAAYFDMAAEQRRAIEAGHERIAERFEGLMLDIGTAMREGLAGYGIRADRITEAARELSPRR